VPARDAPELLFCVLNGIVFLILGFEHGGTKSRNSLLHWPGEGTEQAFFYTRKNQFSMKYLAQQVVFALLTSQVKENKLHVLLYSDFWFLPCSNPSISKIPWRADYNVELICNSTL
jgi:hypothetical protein